MVRDPGPGFDVAKVTDSLAAPNLLKPSGRGVCPINQLIDKVEFADGGREVVTQKRRA